mgnify:CR=1 FL=1|jgi:hypothetical protein
MDTKYFIYLCLVQYFIDRMTTTHCHTIKGELLLLFHHIVSVYLYFGSFFFDPMNHLLFSLGVLNHWLFYKRCILTVYTNKYCGLDEETPFNDFFRIFKLSFPNFFHHWYLLVLIIIYDICLVYNK